MILFLQQEKRGARAGFVMLVFLFFAADSNTIICQVDWSKLSHSAQMLVGKKALQLKEAKGNERQSLGEAIYSQRLPGITQSGFPPGSSISET